MEIDVVHLIGFPRFERFCTKLAYMRVNVSMDSIYMTLEERNNDETDAANVAFKLFVLVFDVIYCVDQID